MIWSRAPLTRCLTTSVIHSRYTTKGVCRSLRSPTTRAPCLPEVPTFSEVGFPDFRSITWFALAAPPKMSASLASKINADVLDVLSQREVQEKLRQLELTPAGLNVSDTEAFIKEEATVWGKVIRD